MAPKATGPAPAHTGYEPREFDRLVPIASNATSIDPSLQRQADPFEVLTSRAAARAHLWSTCDILDLLDAVDPLQLYAETSGLIAVIGQDRVQQIIGSAFSAYREAAHG
jgi:hypothetical protein